MPSKHEVAGSSPAGRATSVHSGLKLWHVGLLIAFVILVRAPFLGSPAIHIDEQFYLAVAERWVHGGAIPYVDIWDRKPVGIFALYAVAVATFGDPILGYQLIAAAFVVATCMVIVLIGQELGSSRFALLAAAIYAVSLSLMEGGGGQAPVFHNLFVATGALIAIRVLRDYALSWRRAMLFSGGACLLFGIGMQIKYTCVLESVAISLYLLGMLRHLRHIPHAAATTVLMAFCGLAPTLVAALVYFQIGHWPEFFHANFESIFEKNIWRLSWLEYVWRLVKSLLFCVPFLPFAAVSLAHIVRDWRDGASRHGWNIVVLWLLATVVGAMLIGSPNRLYFLPALVPLALLTSRGFESVFERRQSFARIAGVFLALPVIAAFVIGHTNALQRGERADVYALGDYLREHKTDGCLFVFNRMPILYYLSSACAPTKYMFPNHLSEVSEVRGSGGPGLAELRRVLAGRPALVFERVPYSEDLDPEAIAIFQKAMQENYSVALERQGYQQTYRIYTPKQ